MKTLIAAESPDAARTMPTEQARVIQIMFDTKIGVLNKELYVSQITGDCDGRRTTTTNY
ncbi:MAG: hypothetical protein WB561_15610 [Terracidiphilus sp.]